MATIGVPHGRTEREEEASEVDTEAETVVEVASGATIEE